MLQRITALELAEWNAYFQLLSEEAEPPDTPETNPGGWEEI